MRGKTMEGFEKFTGRAVPASRKIPRIAIQTRGNMSLNKAAYEALGSPPAVFLLFNKTTRAVGLQPTKLEEAHSYPVRKQPGSESYMIGARAFCQFYELDVSSTRAFAPKLQDGILVFEFDKGDVIAPRKRAAHADNT
jgi:hypothetical protein